MKKVLLIASAILLMASAANAVGMVGLYNDLNHCVCTVTSPQYSMFDTYVFMVNSAVGIKAAEYKIVLPAGFMATGAVLNPDINLSMGDYAAGITVSFSSCWMDWVWAQKLTILNMAGAIPTIIVIEGAPASLPYYLQSASCDEEAGFPIYPLEVLNHMYVNQPCIQEVATEESSWGAIKNLF